MHDLNFKIKYAQIAPFSVVLSKRRKSNKVAIKDSRRNLVSLPVEKWGFLLLSMSAIMFLGFFIDFIEISYIVVPILLPVAETVGIDRMWFALLIAMNLQTSFLTPPFGFSLFSWKGVCPLEVRTLDIYKGVLPFILLQVMVLISIMLFPHLYGLH
ncbi:MAG: TRAP transporter large permease subunit [Candidatus Electrothrix sp. Rat3]|nr:TRAP transporter large permease subunit [Candidatus Electrothrix rattekaaiensis]